MTEITFNIIKYMLHVHVMYYTLFLQFLCRTNMCNVIYFVSCNILDDCSSLVSLIYSLHSLLICIGTCIIHVHAIGT